MNILFVNYGDFTTNSLNHIAGFAKELAAAGHACAVAVPRGKETVAVVPDPRFEPVTYEEALGQPALFPDGRPAGIVHAWTPRETVRKFVLAYQALAHARLIIHLEDNEEFLLAAWLGRSLDGLPGLTEIELAQDTSIALAHPRRYRHFLRVADGVTVIVDALRKFVPTGKPCHLLQPGVDFSQYKPMPADPGYRRELGLQDGEKVIVFTGSNTFANEPEMRDLYGAVALLNKQGMPTRLVRTGFSSVEFRNSLPEGHKIFVKDLGFIAKAGLPRLLALADVLVQPGRPGPFNDFRLPSKLPEFFSVGKPVILPATNLGNDLRDGSDALLLREGSPEEIAAACIRVFTDPSLARTLGKNAAAVAKRHFDLVANTRGLAKFYDEVRNAPATAGSTMTATRGQTELSLALRGLAARTSDPEAAALAEDLAPLVEALERQDIAQAERIRLERELAETHRHGEVLRKQHLHMERELALAQQHVANLANLNRVRLRRLEEAVRLGRQHVVHLENVRGALQRRAQELDGQCRRLNDALSERGKIIIQHEGKIRIMQESFSWRLTAPLRYLRRKLIDPWRSPPSPAAEPTAAPARPAPAADAGQPAPPLLYSVDRPLSWSLPARKTLFRGWCFSDDGRKITAMRAVLPDRTVDGTYGLKRPDVLASMRAKPQAEHSGWQFEVELTASDRWLDLQAADESGAWQSFLQTDLEIVDGAEASDSISYSEWIEVYDAWTPDNLRAQIEQAGSFAYQPLISVLMPAYNTPERWLRRAIDSVRAQTYQRWELCIADDASTEPHVRPLLEQASREDARIKVCFREQNGHISAASNSALALASGDFIALLDHDDELAPSALLEVTAALETAPEADYLYSDEDKIDEEGRRHEPHFKPDWLLDLFTAQNYTSHLSIYRTALVRSVGGFRAGFEGSQDWDLTLRIIEKTERIVHIPKILYHWRAIPGSTALLLGEKDYPTQAAHKALTEHFARLGQKVEILPVPGGHWRIKYSLPADPPLVSIIIPTRNALPLLQRCVDGILEKTTYPKYEIIVMDNGSDDPATLDYLRTLSDGSHRLLQPRHTARVVRHDGPFNYSAINNLGVREARGEIVGLLNNDLEVINPDWLEEMASQALRPEIGCVGAMLYYHDNTIQHAGCLLGVGGVAGHAFKTFLRGDEGKFNRARLVQNYSAVTAACLVVRKAVYEQVGGLDEQALAVAFNDVDFCLKVRAAGYRNLWTPFAEFYHHESATRGDDDTSEKAGRFRFEVETMLRRWGPILRQDPAYNPNLTLEHEDFSLASPPRPAVPA